MKDRFEKIISYNSTYWKSKDAEEQVRQKNIIEEEIKFLSNRMKQYKNLNTAEACGDRMLYLLCINMLKEF